MLMADYVTAVKLLVAAALAMVHLLAVRPMQPAGDGLNAQFFANPASNGPPSRSGTDRDPFD